MTDPVGPAGPVEDRVAALERQLEWLRVELASVRTVLESMVVAGHDILRSDP